MAKTQEGLDRVQWGRPLGSGVMRCSWAYQHADEEGNVFDLDEGESTFSIGGEVVSHVGLYVTEWVGRMREVFGRSKHGALVSTERMTMWMEDTEKFLKMEMCTRRVKGIGDEDGTESALGIWRRIEHPSPNLTFSEMDEIGLVGWVVFEVRMFVGDDEVGECGECEAWAKS